MTGSLTLTEKQVLQNLNAAQIIKQHPDLVLKAHEQARSFTEILITLGLSPTNTRARTNLKNFYQENNLPIPHYKNYQATEEYHTRKRIPKEEALARFASLGKHVGTSLRKWVLEYDLIPYHCSTPGCPLSNPDNIVWNNKPITLDLDHIDGNNTNNSLTNLRWLCPNCHSQTETYKGNNKRRKDKPKLDKDLRERRRNFENLPDANSLWEEMKTNPYTALAKKYHVTVYDLKVKLLDYTGEDPRVHHIQAMLKKKRPHTSTTAHLNLNRTYQQEDGVKRLYSEKPHTRKATYPSDEELIRRITETGYEALSRELGVSGNAIRKYVKNRLGYEPKRVKRTEK